MGLPVPLPIGHRAARDLLRPLALFRCFCALSRTSTAMPSPPTPAKAPPKRPLVGWRELGVLTLLVATLALGALLRAQLAGAFVVGVFAHLRHAHSHLGYYGVLFPALWAVWSVTREGRALSPATLLAYGVGCVAAAIGFATSGYGALSIAASTVVAAVWLFSAWHNRRLLVRLLERDWLAASPIAVVIACGFIPFIAISTRSDPALAQSLVRVFLGVLLFAAVLPAALSRLRAEPPLALPYLLVALVAAVGAGSELHPLFGAGLVVIGFVIGRAVAKVPELSIELRALWLAFALGTVLFGLGLLPKSAATSVAALHYVILGPLLCTFAPDRFPSIPAPLRLGHIAATLLMVGAIYLGNHPELGLPLSLLSAVFGGLVLLIDATAVGLVLVGARVK